MNCTKWNGLSGSQQRKGLKRLRWNGFNIMCLLILWGCIQCSLIISISHFSIPWNIADLPGVTRLKKTDFLSTTIAPHLGERGSWAPPNSMLDCWVVWSCVDCLDVVQAATAATSSWMQPQKIQTPVSLLLPAFFSASQNHGSNLSPTRSWLTGWSSQYL